jgi:hypothetical protein
VPIGTIMTLALEAAGRQCRRFTRAPACCVERSLTRPFSKGALRYTRQPACASGSERSLVAVESMTQLLVAAANAITG